MNTTKFSFQNARDEVYKLIEQEAQVLNLMKQKGLLGLPVIMEQSGKEILQTQLDDLRRQIAALREYCMIDSLDSLNLESKRLSNLTVGLKRLTWVLAVLAVIQIILALLRK